MEEKKKEKGNGNVKGMKEEKKGMEERKGMMGERKREG